MLARAKSELQMGFELAIIAQKLKTKRRAHPSS
jgi:hypothetical protein